jgi:hypothetical protein
VIYRRAIKQIKIWKERREADEKRGRLQKKHTNLLQPNTTRLKYSN